MKEEDGFSLSEPNISFPPTYKFDVNSSCYDTSSKKRIPSYTDRILFKVNGLNDLDLSCKCLEYNSIETLNLSDHKPVLGLFDIKVSFINFLEKKTKNLLLKG